MAGGLLALTNHGRGEGCVSDFSDVLGRAQTDFDFYLAMQANPDAALAPYTLTPAERQALRDPGILWRLLAESGIQRVGGISGIGPLEPPEGPPVEGPPLEGPPLEGPPIEGPPVEGPPIEGPPLEGPPLEGPPIEGPPLEGPPLEGPPLEGPPLEGPPIGVGIIPVTPIEGPPLEGPPLEGPPIGGIGIHGPGGGVGITPVITEPVSPGITVVIHFLTGPDVSNVSDLAQLREIVGSRAVVSAVQRIRVAANSQDRLAAVNALMREIG